MTPTPSADSLRDRCLRAVVLGGAALVVITEALSAFGIVNRTSVGVCWLVLLLAVLRPIRRPRLRVDWLVLSCCVAIVGILLLTAVTAAFSPPNSSDAMAYHLPRVVYWAEQSSVRFFPTPYLNQIMLQPFAEYAMLHLYLLTGGDHWVNFVQWAASLVSIAGVSAVAGQMGFPARGQAVAALFCATIPAGILASSGAKNDYVLAMWLIVAVYFALRLRAEGRGRDALALGAALGCGLLTKGTAYLFLPWPLAVILWPRWREAKALAIAAAAALAINAPQYARNYGLSGSVMGFDSAQGDGLFRWRNETFGWKQTTSNFLRHLSEQLGGRSNRWNQGVYQSVLTLHQKLGLDANDPATTWRWSIYAPPRNANHETDIPNRWHLALLLAFGVWHVGQKRLPGAYALSLVAGMVVFCAYLKWQPFMARLFLPVFVAGAPLTALCGRWKPALLPLALCLLLLDTARLPLLENWVRPLRGPRSVLHVPRDRQYFADMTTWDNEAAYRESTGRVVQAGCSVVGVDIANLQLEYPLLALIREKQPGTQFLHTGVRNASARYPQPVAGTPCAVVCLDCVGDSARQALYVGFPHSAVTGKFVVYW